ncbi:hypothetical protein NM208_g1376 [Fusarium decemcellulare]|uniref:Uncharacterized protein n=2 Tax=Fusarium decemcellulare TaxID=57161 RepID=A0ACC1SSJ3_9HYPO|nr:hypothetical protein NM208_g2470 [Fusarium decemcellulare]KAJ3547701.1 hypothetical protein NM208_g1376 [Fusarium decemcellulare]
MDPSGSSTFPFCPFSFAEAGKSFFERSPDVEKLLSADPQSLVDSKYLRLAHSLIQDALEAEQTNDPFSPSAYMGELARTLVTNAIQPFSNITRPLAPLSLVDCLCHLLWQVVSQKDELSIVLKCWFLSRTHTRPSLEDTKRILLEELRQQHRNVFILDVDDFCHHMDALFTTFKEITQTGPRIFIISQFSIPDRLNVAGIAHSLWLENEYSNIQMGCLPGNHLVRPRSRPSPTQYIYNDNCEDAYYDVFGSIETDEELAVVKPMNANSSLVGDSVKALIWDIFAFQCLTIDQIKAATGHNLRYLPPVSDEDTDCITNLPSLGSRIRRNSNEEAIQSRPFDVEDIPQDDPHAFLARQCLSYISSSCSTGRLPKTNDELKEWLTRFPLLDYAGRYWGEHARKVQPLPDRLVDQITTFLESRHLEEISALLLSNAMMREAERYSGAFKRMTGLHLAAAFGLVKVVSRMLQSGKFKPDLQTEGDWTALHWAVLKGHEDMVTFLSSLPDSVLNLATRLEGWTALHLAAKHNCYSIVHSLTTERTVNAQDRWGRTALYLACWGGHTHIIQHLLSQGADPNISNVYGTTLHCAVKRGDHSVIHDLISAKSCPVDLNLKDPLQVTALEEAQRRGLADIAAILLNAGAKSETCLEFSSQKHQRENLTLDFQIAFDRRNYEVDPDLSGLVRRGKQCRSGVLRLLQQGNPNGTDQILEAQDLDTHFRVLKVSSHDIDWLQKYLLSEWRIVSKLDHPHIARYLDSDDDPYRNEFVLYMEYCDHGDLAFRHGLSLEDVASGDDKKYGFVDGTMIRSPKCTPLTGLELWGMIWQLSSALAYLHYGLTISKQDNKCTAFLEDSWSCIIHRDVKPANVVLQSAEEGTCIFKLCDLGIATNAGLGLDQNQTQWVGSSGLQPPEVMQGEHWTTKGDLFSLGETIRMTSKVRDELLNSKAFRGFMDSARQADCDLRISSLAAMEVAYEILISGSAGIPKLPRSVTEEMTATHELLNNGEGYLFRVFIITAGFLDVMEPDSSESTKVNRKSIISRLWLLLDDGAEETFSEKCNESTAHLLVLLEGRSRTEKLSRMRQLDKFLEGGGNINHQWPKSGWTALHLAAQEGKHAAVGTLLRHGAKVDIKDMHGRTARDSAEESGLTEMAAQLTIPTGRVVAETLGEGGGVATKRRKLM